MLYNVNSILNNRRLLDRTKKERISNYLLRISNRSTDQGVLDLVASLHDQLPDLTPPPPPPPPGPGDGGDGGDGDGNGGGGGDDEDDDDGGGIPLTLELYSNNNYILDIHTDRRLRFVGEARRALNNRGLIAGYNTCFVGGVGTHTANVRPRRH